MSNHGGRREGAGRKPKGEQKLSSTVRIPFMQADRERLERAAEARGLSLAELARKFILQGLGRLKA